MLSKFEGCREIHDECYGITQLPITGMSKFQSHSNLMRTAKKTIFPTRNKKLLGAPGLTTSNKKLLVTGASLLGTRGY